MKTIRKIYLSAFALLLTIAGMQAQKTDEAKIYGQIKDKGTDKKLENCTVEVLKDGQLYDTYLVEGSGKYDFYVPLGFTYDIKFNKESYVSKFVRIDTRNIPEEDRSGGFSFTLDMSLFKYVQGFNESILKDPIGKADFDPIKNSIEWDYQYTERMQEKIEAEFKRLEDLAASLDDLKKNFDELMLKGDQKMLEKKYGEAVEKYEAALVIFPDDQTAKTKYADAKKKFDDEMAKKDFEARYQKLLADGEKYLKAKNYNDAKKNYQDASNMKPDERLPKDKLSEIERLLAGLADKEKYDELVADADSKFKNKDYAVSIEKYREASKLMPNEVYPKEQITKAQIELDKLLSDEAKRQELEKRYNDLITLGDRNMKEKNYEAARNNFTEASSLKPDEQLPKDRLAEIEQILAELAAKEQAGKAADEANAEKARIDKEYQQHIDTGNSLFDEEKLESSRAEYVAALTLKPNEKYPKTRIARIDEMLAEAVTTDSGDLAEQNRLKEEEKKRQEAEAKAQLDEQQRLAEAERLARLEKENLEQQALEAERRRKEEEQERLRRQLESNVDLAKEDEVEEYYRNARESEDVAKSLSVSAQKELVKDFHASRDSESYNKRIGNWEKTDEKKQNVAAMHANANGDDKLAVQLESVNNQKDAMTRIQRNGDLVNTREATKADEEKSEAAENAKEYRERSDNSRQLAYEKTEAKKDNSEKIVQDDSKRQLSERKANEKKEKAASNQQAYTKKGDAQRQNNQYAVNKEKGKQQNLADAGEESRRESEQKVEVKKENITKHHQDLQAASGERQSSAEDNVEDKKEMAAKLNAEKNLISIDNELEVNEKKNNQQIFIKEKNRKAAANSYEKRDELFDKDRGGLKDADDYMARPGSESIAEGITEKSYQSGNKIVIERTLKIGNKVDYYRKVVSKTGIYYFKNDKAITEQTWDAETLLKE